MRRLKHALNAIEAHAEIKADDELWERCTIAIGEMSDGDGSTLELRNCRTCMSTLARPQKKGT